MDNKEIIRLDKLLNSLNLLLNTSIPEKKSETAPDFKLYGFDKSKAYYKTWKQDDKCGWIDGPLLTENSREGTRLDHSYNTTFIKDYPGYLGQFGRTNKDHDFFYKKVIKDGMRRYYEKTWKKNTKGEWIDGPLWDYTLNEEDEKKHIYNKKCNEDYPGYLGNKKLIPISLFHNNIIT